MIFPTLSRSRCGYVHLDLAASAWLEENPGLYMGPLSNPFNDPHYCAVMVETLNADLGLAFSYGGWMEIRSTLWKDSYLQADQKFLHLGVDLNAPVDTEIAVDFNAEVVHVDDDHPEEGGWGPRVIFLHKKARVYVVYAHLGNDVTLKPGDKVKAGEVFAKVGHPKRNGGWYPHVHVQAVEDDVFRVIEKNGLETLDGYYWPNCIQRGAGMFPDPLQYIRLTK